MYIYTFIHIKSPGLERGKSVLDLFWYMLLLLVLIILLLSIMLCILSNVGFTQQ